MSHPIRAYREKAGLSISALSGLSGIHRRTIERIEAGVQTARESTTVSYLKACGVKNPKNIACTSSVLNLEQRLIARLEKGLNAPDHPEKQKYWKDSSFAVGVSTIRAAVKLGMTEKDIAETLTSKTRLGNFLQTHCPEGYGIWSPLSGLAQDHIICGSLKAALL